LKFIRFRSTSFLEAEKKRLMGLRGTSADISKGVADFQRKGGRFDLTQHVAGEMSEHYSLGISHIIFELRWREQNPGFFKQLFWWRKYSNLKK